MEFDPLALDRRLSRAEEAARDWRVRLRAEAEFEDDPFARYRTDLGRTQYQQVEALDAADPMRWPLLRWTHALMEQRINHRWTTLTHKLRYHTQCRLSEPARGNYTLHEMLTRVMTEPSRAEHWWRAAAEHAEPLADAERTLWERRQAIAEELDLDSPDTLELPCPEIVEVANHCLRVFDPLLEQFRQEQPHLWVQSALAGPAAESFPARLSEATVADWFRDVRLLEDLPLRRWQLPELFGASSFVRVLDQLGCEFRWASAPSNQPFTVAHDPHELENHTLGGCFASLAVNPSFVLRRLGVGRDARRDLLRSLATTVLLDCARRAVVVLLRSHLSLAKDRFAEQLTEVVGRWLGPYVPPSLALVWLRLTKNDAQRFAGALCGFSLAAELTESHDQDWYRHPRAVDQLRAAVAAPPRTQVPADELCAAIDAQSAMLASLL